MPSQPRSKRKTHPLSGRQAAVPAWFTHKFCYRATFLSCTRRRAKARILPRVPPGGRQNASSNALFSASILPRAPPGGRQNSVAQPMPACAPLWAAAGSCGGGQKANGRIAPPRRLRVAATAGLCPRITGMWLVNGKHGHFVFSRGVNLAVAGLADLRPCRAQRDGLSGLRTRGPLELR